MEDKGLLVHLIMDNFKEELVNKSDEEINKFQDKIIKIVDRYIAQRNSNALESLRQTIDEINKGN